MIGSRPHDVMPEMHRQIWRTWSPLRLGARPCHRQRPNTDLLAGNTKTVETVEKCRLLGLWEEHHPW